ncbi:esterase B1-like isoform X2 [Sitodiplosis mosellana]|uniref:esterase B1-like isoform X2 n=1 Tax=Sitodiplosis mosellana TaxID=263140 RepID=UPI00244475F8|nr:esterase B1-like isoform X2 [Sitodiplosis mosellana]
MYEVLYELMPILLLLTSIANCDFPTVRQTTNGPVEGTEQTSFFGKKYYSFRGIPYAEVPITGNDPYTGETVDRRFKSPQPLVRQWTEPLKVQNFGDGCITSSGWVPATGNTSENCLFVNIYVPEKKTVLIFIHGGGFTEGTSNDFQYGPDFLIDADNILVTLNYRVGVFGFMNLGFGEYTGNMGLKDQQLALKWIYENIEHFSGNQNEIMLFGESAGGASVNLHMLNEESRKYFNRAFALSSSSLNNYVLYEPNHLERMQKISNIQDKLQLVEYLKTADSTELAKILRTNDLEQVLLQKAWNPTIESPETKDAFITKTSEEIYKSDKAPVMDTMFSIVSQEYVSLKPDLSKNTEPLLSEDWKNSKIVLPFSGFDKDTYPEEYKHAIDLLKDAYFNDTTNADAIKRGNIALLSDSNFGYGILKAARYQVIANNKGTPKNTFLLRFSVNADINAFKILFHLNIDGASHGEELCYMFRCGLFDSYKLYENALQARDDSNVNYRTIRRMVDIITNFARTGNPSVEGDTPFMSSTSPDEILSQDITNDPNSSLVTNIMDQLHFNTWKQIDDSYKRLKINDNL